MAVNSVGSVRPSSPLMPNPPASGTGAAQDGAGYDPNAVPLAGPRNHQPDAAAPAARTASNAPAKSADAAKDADPGAQIDNLIKEYDKAVEAGLDTAIADLLSRILQLGVHGALLFLAVVLTAASGGAFTPFLIWVAASTALNCVDTGCSVYNLAQRAKGNDGLTYHGDSIANLTKAVCKKLGITNEAKIDQYTNIVSTSIRCLAGGITLPANHLHRSGGKMIYSDYRLSELQRQFAKQQKQQRKEEDEIFSLDTDGARKAAALPGSNPNPQRAAAGDPGSDPENRGNGGNPPASVSSGAVPQPPQPAPAPASAAGINPAAGEQTVAAGTGNPADNNSATDASVSQSKSSPDALQAQSKQDSDKTGDTQPAEAHAAAASATGLDLSTDKAVDFIREYRKMSEQENEKTAEHHPLTHRREAAGNVRPRSGRRASSVRV